MGGETFGDGVGDTAGVDVGDCDERAAGLACHGCDEEADCAGSNYEGG